MANSLFIAGARILFDGKSNHELDLDLQEIHVKEVRGEVSTFGFTLAAGSLSEAEIRWVDDASIALGRKLQISLGYGTEVTNLLLGEISSIALAVLGNECTITVSGEDLRYRMGRFERTRGYENQSIKGIIEELARGHGFKVTGDARGDTLPHVLQNNCTDLAFLNRCADDAGRIVTMKEDTLHLLPLSGEDPPLALEMGLDVTTFSHTATNHDLAGVVEIRSTKTIEKNPIVGRATFPRLKRALPEDNVFSDETRVYLESAVLDEKRAGEVAGHRVARLVGARGKGEGSGPGHPEIRVGRRIQLQGLGKRFSGIYLVVGAEHKISNEGYRTTFTVEEVNE